jgi:hypothetical protein
MLGNSASESKSVLTARERKRRLSAPQIVDAEPEIAGKWPRPARVVFILGAALAAWGVVIAAVVYGV